MAGLVVSADSHVIEPATLWTERLDKKFQDKAPKVVQNEKGAYQFVAPGIYPSLVAANFGMGKGGAELKEHLTKGYEGARPSGWDPAERLKDQELDGVAAEVLYTSLGMKLFALDDGDLQQACFSVFNTWLAEYASYAPKRLCPIAMISLEHVAAGVKELERCAKLGCRGAMIWGVPPEGRSYSESLNDPFWAAAQDLDLPISLHFHTERKQPEIRLDSSQNPPLPVTFDPIIEIKPALHSML